MIIGSQLLSAPLQESEHLLILRRLTVVDYRASVVAQVSQFIRNLGSGSRRLSSFNTSGWSISVRENLMWVSHP
jgi:hypothetical protein